MGAVSAQRRIKKEGFTLHAAMQNNKPKSASTYTEWVYGNADFN
jgi:hypothetical protein